LIYNEDFPDWLKKYSFKNFCCWAFKTMVYKDIITKTVGKEKGEIHFCLQLFDYSEESEPILVQMLHCPFCGKKLAELDFEVKDTLNEEEEQKFEELEIQHFPFPENSVGQMILWDFTGKLLNFKITYKDHNAFTKLHNIATEQIKKQR
jgi:hypothetical protein